MPEIIESLRNANLGWQFYKNYYEFNGGAQSLENKNHTIVKRKFTDSTDYFKIDCNNFFKLKLNYPGLLTGSGYTHEYTGEDKDGAFKIGFFFDHISGMPYITGHGIKGALRYAFPNHKKEKYPDSKAKFITDLLSENGINPEYVFNEYLSSEGINNVPYNDLTFTRLLGELIFEGNKPIAYRNNEFVYLQMPLKDKDIFFDCYIIGTGDDDLFLGDDYITPHIPNPLKNPVPIKFLKILPDTLFRFQFDLKDNLITSKQKEGLFRSLLLTFGIGAKTNVGYGQFSEKTPDSNEKSSSADKFNEEKPKRENCFPKEITGFLKKNNSFDGEVIDSDESYIKIQFFVNKNLCFFWKRKTEKFIANVGDNVTVTCSNDFSSDNHNLSVKKKN